MNFGQIFFSKLRNHLIITQANNGKGKGFKRQDDGKRWKIS